MEIFNKLLEKVVAMLEGFHPLNDWLYPKLLDRYGHTVARRVCGFVLIVACFTVLPWYFLVIFVWNNWIEVMNACLGWYAAVKQGIFDAFSAKATDE